MGVPHSSRVFLRGEWVSYSRLSHSKILLVPTQILSSRPKRETCSSPATNPSLAVRAAPPCAQHRRLRKTAVRAGPFDAPPHPCYPHPTMTSAPNQSLATTTCIIGGGPAGIMLGFLLARAGHPRHGPREIQRLLPRLPRRHHPPLHPRAPLRARPPRKIPHPSRTPKSTSSPPT